MRHSGTNHERWKRMIREYWEGRGYKPPVVMIVTVLNPSIPHAGDDLLGIRSNMVNGLPIGGPLQ